MSQPHNLFGRGSRPVNEVGEAPEQLDYDGPAKPLERVWLATRASLRAVLEDVTLDDIARDHLPARVDDLHEDPEAWSRR